jgi:hypothetical protein
MRSVSPERPIKTGTSRRMSWEDTTRGAITAEAPRMISTFTMLLPTTLPRARSGWPAQADLMLTASSGALVP